MKQPIKVFSDIYGDKTFVEKHQSGICPVCGNESIEYQTIEVDDGQVFYPAICGNGHNFEEWYSLEFIESVQQP
jgi:hypothetical protein